MTIFSWSLVTIKVVNFVTHLHVYKHPIFFSRTLKEIYMYPFLQSWRYFKWILKFFLNDHLRHSNYIFWTFMEMHFAKIFLHVYNSYDKQ